MEPNGKTASERAIHEFMIGIAVRQLVASNRFTVFASRPHPSAKFEDSVSQRTHAFD